MKLYSTNSAWISLVLNTKYIYLYIYSTAIEYNKFYSAEFNKNKKFSFKLNLWKCKKACASTKSCIKFSTH